ncbi:MAG: hypothetical protein R3F29_14580 [Planctomycetota bacterium]
MSERHDQAPPPPPPQPPTGAPQSLTLDGIVEGRVADATALGAAVEALSSCGAGRFRLEITGGRFNVLPEETQASGTRFDEDAQAAFVTALEQVLAAASPGSIGTTLRCTLVYPDQVAETLFAMRGSRLEPLTRRRARGASDAPPLPGSGAPPLGTPMPRRQLLLLAPLLLLAGAMVAWQAGWVERVLAARAEDLRTDPGPFGAMLQVEAARSWGNYEIVLRRGDDYPATPEQLTRRRDASTDLAGRAATAVVGDGGELFVQLRDEHGDLLAEQRAELRPLLTDAEGKVLVRLPGRISAQTVRLSLDSGKAPK